jgi:hypothetical protein
MIETSLASIAESLKIIAAALGCTPEQRTLRDKILKEDTATLEHLTGLGKPLVTPGPCHELKNDPACEKAVVPCGPAGVPSELTPIPEPVPAEVSFDDLVKRVFRLRDTGKVWPAGPGGNAKIKEWAKEHWNIKSLQEATPEQRVLIWAAVAGLETA